jgi:hypothetical protein
MTADVVILDVETTLDLPLDRILNGARDAEVSDCLLLGYEPSGDFYMASQTTDAGKMLILLERARAVLRHRLGIE